MSNELIFIIGLSIGALLGVVTICLFVSVRITDLQVEIRDLRIQRQLLKEEIEKPRGKPKPRVKRKKI
jgi:flagellar biosynthesis protein FlhB|tara:strand:+ start:1584 stop:1787 length:204 start_codon:yes stop_codon:yes gene_type:complete